MSLSGKTLLISGASRGIGLAIALRAARDGACIGILAKTEQPDPRLPGTIYSAARAIEEAGGQALPLAVDIRDEEALQAAVNRVGEHFGGIDICVCNASAIFLAGSSELPTKRLDLMLDINVRGTYLTAQACLPWLRQSSNAHILTLSPPINLDPKWFAGHPAYTTSKYAMSLMMYGLSAEGRAHGIAANALWPRTVIDTAALSMLGGRIQPGNCRSPAIVAEAAWHVFQHDARQYTGQFLVDEEVLRAAGISDFTPYAVDPQQPLLPDFFL